MKIPGLSFSWKRALGVTAVKQKVARATGIPTTRGGLERKVGSMVLGAIFGKKKRKKRENFYAGHQHKQNFWLDKR